MRAVLDSELVSVIIPVYNSLPFLKDSIESIIAQTYQEWELIIVDDGSTDGSVELIKQYAERDSRIRLILLGENKGAAIARNRGIQEARGRYIAFNDSDDMWKPHKLERQLRFMKETGALFSFTAFDKIDENGKFLKRISVPYRLTYWKNLWFNRVSTITAMYDAKKLGKLYMPNLERRQDYGLWLKILKLCDGYGLNEVLSICRRRKGSLSNINKLHLVKYNWKLYREIEELSLPVSLWALMGDVVSKLFMIK